MKAPEIKVIALNQAGYDYSEIERALEICHAINNDNIAVVMCKGFSDTDDYCGIYYSDYEEEISAGELGEALDGYYDFQLWITNQRRS